MSQTRILYINWLGAKLLNCLRGPLKKYFGNILSISDPSPDKNREWLLLYHDTEPSPLQDPRPSPLSAKYFWVTPIVSGIAPPFASSQTTHTLRWSEVHRRRKRSCLASLLALVVLILSIHLYSGSSSITNSSTKLFTWTMRHRLLLCYIILWSLKT